MSLFSCLQVHQLHYSYDGTEASLGAGMGQDGMMGAGGGVGMGEGSSRVIQVGNMLQVLPQDPSATAPTPSPMIVQTGNVIQASFVITGKES